MKSRLGLIVLIANAMLPGRAAGVWTGPYIDLKLTGAAKEYCHVVGFSKGWQPQRFEVRPAFPKIDYEYSDYEFRVEGLLGTWFLIGAFTPNLNLNVNSVNHYRLNLSDSTAPVRSANAQDWSNATVVPLYRKSLLTITGVKPPDQVAFSGFEYKKTGSYPWTRPDTTSRLSPDSAWLILQSATFKKRQVIEVYDVFFDMFSTATGKKLFTIQGRFSGGENPSSSLGTTGWLTERYFIIPLGKRRERCVVCEFAPRGSSGGQ
jgi:hypothetical protein